MYTVKSKMNTATKYERDLCELLLQLNLENSVIFTYTNTLSCNSVQASVSQTAGSLASTREICLGGSSTVVTSRETYCGKYMWLEWCQCIYTSVCTGYKWYKWCSWELKYVMCLFAGPISFPVLKYCNLLKLKAHIHRQPYSILVFAFRPLDYFFQKIFRYNFLSISVFDFELA